MKKKKNNLEQEVIQFNLEAAARCIEELNMQLAALHALRVPVQISTTSDHNGAVQVSLDLVAATPAADSRPGLLSPSEYFSARGMPPLGV